MAKIFLDANVILEVLFKRAGASQVKFELAKSSPLDELLVSVLSADLVMYFVEKEKYPADLAFEMLRKFKIADMDDTDYLWAVDNHDGDFEDGLQVACALRHRAKAFITLDGPLQKRHSQHLPIKLIR